MPNPTTPEFRPEFLEQDVTRLAAEVKLHLEKPESKELSDQQIVKEAVRSMAEQHKSSGQPANPAGGVASILPAYVKDFTPEEKLEVEYLLDLAFKKGLDQALKEAAKSNPAIEDAVHDALAGKLYPFLQQRGIIK